MSRVISTVCHTTSRQPLRQLMHSKQQARQTEQLENQERLTGSTRSASQTSWGVPLRLITCRSTLRHEEQHQLPFNSQHRPSCAGREVENSRQREQAVAAAAAAAAVSSPIKREQPQSESCHEPRKNHERHADDDEPEPLLGGQLLLAIVQLQAARQRRLALLQCFGQ